MIGESNRFRKLRYPRLLLLALTYLVVFALFAWGSYPGLGRALVGLGYAGSFAAGFLYAFAFTAAPATAVLLLIGGEQSLLASGLVAGAGALVGDLLIFHFVRGGFGDEARMLSEEGLVRRVGEAVPAPMRGALYMAVAGILIASPLPTELGVALMASATGISSRRFAFVAYVLHTLGILAILFAGSLF